MRTEAVTGAEAEAIRAQLKRITEHREFAGAPRLCGFLRFVVETALAGRASEIKESLIAVEVYGRPADYNPQIDSTVRVEAGRLRLRLRKYYDSLNGPDPVRIDLPKGAYVPVFQFAEASSAPEPVRPATRRWPVVATATVMVALVSWSGTAPKAGPFDSVAVLPFVNLTGDSATDRFCEGLTEEVTTSLARSNSIRVAARTAVRHRRGANGEVTRTGRDHRVRAVLEGSVRQEGGRFVVTTQLIDTSTGFHLWAERYERSAGGALAAQHDVASSVVRSLRSKADGTAASPRPALDDESMALFHRGSDLLRIPVMKDGPPDELPATVTEAQRLFREVVRRSPQFARGWAALAESAEWEYELRGNQPQGRLAEAKAAALRAVQIQPDLVEGWNVLTSIQFYREWDLEAARFSCGRAIEIEPRNVAARQRYIDILLAQDRREEARQELDQVVKLHAASAPIRVRRALMLLEEGHYARAFTEAEAAGALTNQMPAYAQTFWIRGLALEQLGKKKEAEEMFRQALARQPHDPWSEPALGHLLARSGRQSEAQAILAELERQQNRGRMTHVSRAIVYIGLNRAEDALSALEEALTVRDDALLRISRDPRLRPLHSIPRYRAIRARLSAA